MENQVELQAQEIVPADQEQAPEGEALSSIETEEQPEPKEPGWIKGRIDKAVSRALKEQEDRLRGEYEAKLAPLYESMMDRQAQELVDSGEFKSIDRAKEYVRMKAGVPQAPQAPQTPEPQANENMDVRAQILARQAQKIKANYGIDVMGMYQNDPEVKRKILSTEWDFYDVMESTKSPPSPVRTPNGGYSAASVSSMSDEQFRRLQENLAKGRKYDMRK